MTGLKIAYLELLRVLYQKGAINTVDLDEIGNSLTDLSGAYEMNADERAAIERFSESFQKLRPDRLTTRRP